MSDNEKDKFVTMVDFSAYEAMDRLACLHDSFHTQIVNHLFYHNTNEQKFRDLIEEIDDNFAVAYQIAAQAHYDLNGLEDD